MIALPPSRDSYEAERRRYLRYLEQTKTQRNGEEESIRMTPLFSLAVKYAVDGLPPRRVSLSDDELDATASSTEAESDIDVAEETSYGFSDANGTLLSQRIRPLLPQYGLLGFNIGGNDGTKSPEPIMINVHAPNSFFICGSQGSGKSYTLTCLLENFLIPDDRFGRLQEPVAGLVFHYDSDSSGAIAETVHLASRGVKVKVLVSSSNFEATQDRYHFATQGATNITVEKFLLKRTTLTLLLDVKGAFDRVSKTQLLKRMIQVGMAGNIVHWVNSFLSNRRAMLVIDGRTSETRDIQAGLPQGSPVSPVLFILSISAMFPWLEDRYPMLQAISFVDDIGLLVDCEDLEEGTKQLERIARDTIRWGSDNKVEFEVSKTEVLVFSRRRMVLRKAKDAFIRIGEQTFAINQGATKWLGFWLDPKLSFKTHLETRMASAKGVLKQVTSLSRSNGGLPINLMRKVIVAAVTSIALYGSEIWWRGQQDRLKTLQLLLNCQARAVTGLMRSTPLPSLQRESCLPCARDLLECRQTRYATRALSADGDHPTHQLLPANFRFGELYRHEGATGEPSSTGWARLEKTHRSIGSRLAQQIVRHINYDTEYGFDLPCKVAPQETTPVIRVHGYSQTPRKMLPDQSEQTTVFVRAIKDACFGTAIAWEEANDWKTKAVPLGKHLTETDAALFAVGMAMKHLFSILSRTDHRCAEVVTESRLALTAIQEPKQWLPPIITDIKRQVLRIEDEGGLVVLTWLPRGNDNEGYEKAGIAAQRAARQQSKDMRSASLSFVKQAVKEKWKPKTRLNKHIKDARKSVAARYLQLKSGHAVTGVHLFRINKVQDARCWWCGCSRQTVTHLMLECRKWRRERKTMLQRLTSGKISISPRRDWTDLKTLFGEDAILAVLRFIENTKVGKRLTDDTNNCDSWDIDLLDRGDGEDTTGIGGE